jgi:hypothetical protein
MPDTAMISMPTRMEREKKPLFTFNENLLCDRIFIVAEMQIFVLEKRFVSRVGKKQLLARDVSQFKLIAILGRVIR